MIANMSSSSVTSPSVTRASCHNESSAFFLFGSVCPAYLNVDSYGSRYLLQVVHIDELSMIETLECMSPLTSCS
jgi:hypothetical protein